MQVTYSNPNSVIIDDHCNLMHFGKVIMGFKRNYAITNCVAEVICALLMYQCLWNVGEERINNL